MKSKNILIIALALLFTTALLMGCSGRTSENFNVYTDFEGKKIGVITGMICDVVAENEIGAKAVYYSDTSAGVEDVRRGRIDGFMIDLSIARVISGEFDNLKAVEIPRDIFSGPLGAIAADQDIIDRFNEFLAGLKADGTLAYMTRYWLENNPGSDPSMPPIPLTGENGVLRVATGGTSIPFTYVGANNELKGFSIELATRFAASEGKSIEFSTMDFGGLIPYVISGKADLGIDAITITEERKKSVLFTDSIYDDQLGIITRR